MKVKVINVTLQIELRLTTEHSIKVHVLLNSKYRISSIKRRALNKCHPLVSVLLLISATPLNAALIRIVTILTSS